jgi:hypothetical protein
MWGRDQNTEPPVRHLRCNCGFSPPQATLGAIPSTWSHASSIAGPQARGVTASGYVAHVLRAHLRADPPMPYGEFQELKRVVNELAGIRGAMAQLASQEGSTQGLEPSLKENVL